MQEHFARNLDAAKLQVIYSYQPAAAAASPAPTPVATPKAEAAGSSVRKLGRVLISSAGWKCTKLVSKHKIRK